MKAKQKMLSSSNLVSSSQLFGLGIVTTSLISGAISQRLLATEVSRDNLIKTGHQTGNLEKISPSANSTEVVNISGFSNPKVKLSESILKIESLDKSSAAVDASISQSLELELSKLVTPSINSENVDNSTSQESNISYNASDLQLKNSINSVEGSRGDLVLAQEVDLNTLCQLSPSASRCTNYKSPAESQRQDQLRQQLREISAKRQRRSGTSKAGFYGSISGDARFLSETTVEPIDVNLDFDTGYGVNAGLGYRFRNNLRIEGQFSYGSNEIGEVGLPGTAPVTTTVTNNVITPAVPLTIGAPISTPVNITVPNLGTIPAGTTIPAGVVLNPGPPITNASAINVGSFTVPAGTNLSVVPGLTTIGGTPETTTPTTTTVTTPEVPPTTVEARGKITTLSGLLNLYYDFPVSSNFEPYIGAGIGVSRASAEDVVATSPGTDLSVRLDGSSTVLVYQLMAGVAYYLSPRTALTLGYRYFNVAKQSFDSDPIGEVEADGFGIHNIELGLRFGFQEELTQEL